ncbi:MAG TPA: hypothetical protein VHG10_12935 [Glycomyces sp.]|nr:hypothetical protein [Glycomyces sp.]
MDPYEDVLESVSARDRFRIAFESLEWSLATTESGPIEDAGSREFIDRTLGRVRSALQQGLTLAPADNSLLNELTVQQQNAYEDGVVGIVLALGLCFDELGDQITPDRTLEVLSQCYEFESIRTRPDPIVTEEFERGSARLRDVIDFQQALIGRFAS